MCLVGTLGRRVFPAGFIEAIAESAALIRKVFSGALGGYRGPRRGLAVLACAMGALTKPEFAMAGGAGGVVAARFIDRVGKGIRGAAFGLRQSHDTVGDFGGLLLGVPQRCVHTGMTQGLLAAMVADTAPVDLRGTAFGFFRLLGGVAMRLSSVIAGLLWEALGAAFTFCAGAGFAAPTLLGPVVLRRRN